jgi:hypothetical protein
MAGEIGDVRVLVPHATVVKFPFWNGRCFGRQASGTKCQMVSQHLGDGNFRYTASDTVLKIRGNCQKGNDTDRVEYLTVTRTL